MLVPLVFAALLALVQETAAEAGPAPDRPPELLPHAELVERMRALAEGSGGLVVVLPLQPGARSRAGRELLALRLAEPGVPEDRPAILLVANVDGPQVFSSGVALRNAEEIAARWAAGDAAARAFLGSTTLYVVPRANPDAAEARFAAPLAEVEASGHGADDDRDGLAGEDGPSDVNGDGIVAWMRAPDPEGTWIEDPTEPRALIEADRSRGQTGRWKLWPEGRDSDGDEAVGEDPEQDARVGRNFSAGWKEHEPSAGLFPLDEPEARALAEFLLVHDDVALVVTYGTQDNLVSKPEAVKEAEDRGRIPPAGVLEGDAKLLDEVGRRYRKITGSEVKGSGGAEGSFQAWAYEHRGLFSLAIVLWDIPLDEKGTTGESEQEGAESAEEEDRQEQGGETQADTKGRKDEKEQDDEPKPSDDARRLRWIDAQGEADRFLAWTPFEHPELGPVEIGGFAPYARVEPPDEEAAGIAAKQLEFLLSLGEVLPRVGLAECEAKELGGGLVEVEAAVRIDSLLPLASRAGLRSRTVRPARIELLVPEGAEVVAGQRRVLAREIAGSGGQQTFRWLVRGAPASAIGLRVESDHAGSDRCVPEVK
jgi:hypothetical protein